MTTSVELVKTCGYELWKVHTSGSFVTWLKAPSQQLEKVENRSTGKEELKNYHPIFVLFHIYRFHETYYKSLHKVSR